MKLSLCRNQGNRTFSIQDSRDVHDLARPGGEKKTVAKDGWSVSYRRSLALSYFISRYLFRRWKIVVVCFFRLAE